MMVVLCDMDATTTKKQEYDTKKYKEGSTFPMGFMEGGVVQVEVSEEEGDESHWRGADGEERQ